MEIGTQQVGFTPGMSQIAVVSGVLAHLEHRLNSMVGYGYTL
jgi:hypothetical protein